LNTSGQADSSEQAPYHAQDAANVLEGLQVDPAEGLSAHQVEIRLHQSGPNEVEVAPGRTRWAILVDQLINPVVWLLAAAMALSLGLRDWPEALAIAAVLIINTAIGFAAELNAVRSMEALRRLDLRKARVRRDRIALAVDARQLVRGDIVLLESGDHVPADLRIVECAGARADESALTGESAPVEKSADAIAGSAPLHARTAMLFKGTNLVAGTAEGVVVATGQHTALGEIALLVQSTTQSHSPLEKRLAVLARDLIWLTLGAVLVLGVIGLWSGQPVVQMIQATIALAVAAIPEGLPIVATLALGRGMLRMVRRNALVRSLGAVETLGATSVILTDKTGTLTENHMRITRLALLGSDGAFVDEQFGQGERPSHVADLALMVGVLCSSAEPGEDGFSGDPMEVALLDGARDTGTDVVALRQSQPRLATRPFDAETRTMATVHDGPDGVWVAVKGAPEAVLDLASTVALGSGVVPLDHALRKSVAAASDAMAEAGERLIALARMDGAWEPTDPLQDICLLGIVGLRDPARQDVCKAISDCHEAGLHVVMVTGDHPATARAIAKDVGFDTGPGGDQIYARVAPSEKLGIVGTFQARGAITAMTGDGVNDAPALRKADIGIAMGVRGTDVAKEAADIVLLDDAFGTIVVAIREGRVIFDNIRRVCVYLLSCNLGEIILIAAALIAGMPLPLLPLQILFLNLLTDVFPAFAVALGEAEGDVGRKPPRPADEPVLRRRDWTRIGVYGVLLAIASFVAFWWSIRINGAGPEEASTVAFLTIGFGQLFHVFTMREAGSAIIKNTITRNAWVWLALLFCAAAMLLAVHLPLFADVLSFVPPGLKNWQIIAVCSVIPALIGQFHRTIGWQRDLHAPRTNQTTS
jgi:Ca2+-transporting ATPase